jgi:nucleotide-binding universal stress UspA family protein
MNKLLLAVDGTNKGLEVVSIIGRLLNRTKDTNIVLFHCLQQVATLLPGDICTEIDIEHGIASEDQEKLGQAVLKASLTRLTEAGFPESNVELCLRLDSLDPARDIIDQAEKEQTGTIIVGRRSRSQIQTLLLGSISGKVAHYAADKAVWIVDTPVNDSMKLLIAMEGTPEMKNLSEYTAALFAGCPGLDYTFMHIIPPVPPTFWDDGHILDTTEQTDRQSRIDKWKHDWTQTVSGYMSKGRELLLARGIENQNIESLILETREGVAQDLLTEIDAHKFQVVVMGKKSFTERKPFLMGSHASKLLQNTKGAILCMI